MSSKLEKKRRREKGETTRREVMNWKKKVAPTLLYKGRKGNVAVPSQTAYTRRGAVDDGSTSLVKKGTDWTLHRGRGDRSPGQVEVLKETRNSSRGDAKKKKKNDLHKAKR